MLKPYDTPSNGASRSADDRLDQKREIAAAAPSDLVDDWEVLLASEEETKTAYDEAGLSNLSEEDTALIKAAQFGGRGPLPEGVSWREFRKWQRRLAAIDDDAYAAASIAVRDDFNDRCGAPVSEMQQLL